MAAFQQDLFSAQPAPTFDREFSRLEHLALGGSFQRTWEHCVPRVAHAGPRMSLAFRHGLHPRAYDEPAAR